MRAAFVLVALAVLAGCGVDGEPVPPSGAASQPGVTVGVDARIGVVGGF